MIGLTLALAIQSVPIPEGTPPTGVTPPDTHAVERQAEAYFAATLKDPDSARIRRVSRIVDGVFNTGGSLFTGAPVSHPVNKVCYSVNAKNSYGGYTGNHLYLLSISPEGNVIATGESPYYSYALHRDYPNQEVESWCARFAEDTPEPAPAPTTASAEGTTLLGLVAAGRCADAKAKALADNDATGLLQVEKVCALPSPSR